MTSKDFILNTFRAKGKSDAKALQAQAKDLTATELIANEGRIPEWEPNKDYSSWAIGAPVRYDNQIWVLVEPHSALIIPPKEDVSNWRICHSKDAQYVKPWATPVGSFGHYLKDEVYQDANGMIWKCLQEDTIFSASDFPEYWEKI